MKYIIILIVLLLSSIITNAQNDSTLKPQKSTWQIGILAGPNYEYSNRSFNRGVGLYAGILGTKKIKEIKIETGLLFTQQSSKFSYGSNNGYTAFRSQDLSIPVKFNYYFKKLSTGFYLTTGVFFNFLSWGKALSKEQNKATLSRNIPPKIYYSSVAVLGLGYDYRLNNKYDFASQAFIKKGISKGNSALNFFNITLGINRNL
jgi:hypothetical protein